MNQNPLLQPFTGPFGLAPFSRIRPEHYREAFPVVMAEELAKVQAIADNPEPASFGNVIGALEQAGFRHAEVAGVFYNLAGADTNDALQAIEMEMAPEQARHGNAILLHEKLFARIGAVPAEGLSPEQARVLELTKKRFRRAGAMLSAEARERMKAISERLSVLTTQFGQNVLAEERAFSLPLSPTDLEGLPEWLKDAAASAARERGMEGHIITLSRSLIEPFLTFSARRDLREKAFRAWIARGENGNEHDNRAIANEIVKLRDERAKLLGYANFAAMKLDNEMAKTVGNVEGLLKQVWAPAVAQARREAEKLQSLIAAEGQNFTLKPWDWLHYAEKLRKAEHDLDEAVLKPYLQLEQVIEAAFFVAGKLFGLSFTRLEGLDLHHADARAYEVKDATGRHVALFIGDYFARASKHSGAWMSSFRDQHKLAGDVRPIIINVMNFAKAPEGKPCLLTVDDARTLFHEFGHALHGMMSDVTYPSISGTSVARDFVELPSQLYEHWFLRPEVLSRFALHAETGEPMPQALMDKVIAAARFNQGHATVQYIASAIVDMALHASAPGDVMETEKRVLAEIGMPEMITMRHRVPHFQHVFSGEGYSAGYYSYMWSEVMDADAFSAFEETGDVFNPALAHRLAAEIYAAGGRKDPEDAYVAFRGRKPEITALLRKRGFAA